MIIHSTFNDIYDWCANVYRDESLFYKRETEDCRITEVPSAIKNVRFRGYGDNPLGGILTYNLGHFSDSGVTSVQRSYIVVGDTITHPVYKVNYWIDEKGSPPKWFSKYFVDVDILRKFLVEWGVNLENGGFFGRTQWFDSIVSEDNPSPGFIKAVRSISDAPIVLPLGDTIIENPSLSELGLGGILDHHEVYQELCMFIGKQMNPEVGVENIDDKSLCYGKGFDKMSFRKSKE